MNEVAAAKDLFDTASEILGYDLLKLCVEGTAHAPIKIPSHNPTTSMMHLKTSTWTCFPVLHAKRSCCAGPKEKLDSTVISQPAIYVASLAAVEKLRETEGEVGCSSRSLYPCICIRW